MKTSLLRYSRRAKTPVLPSSRFASKATLLSALAALALGAFASNAMAVDYYWRGTNTNDTWNIATKWYTQPTGGVVHSGPLSLDNTYIITNVGSNVVNTDSYSTGTNSVFSGGTLVLATAGTINLRTFGSSEAQIGNFVTTGGGLITTATNGDVNLTIGSFDNQSGDTRVRASGTAGARTLDLQIGTLTGTGSFSIDSGNTQENTIFITVTDATGYTGNFDFARGTINFNNDLVSDGALTLSGSVSLVLDQNVTFSSVTIGGSALAVGTHTFASLNGNPDFGAFFAEGGSGSIIVAAIPEPSTYAMLAGATFLGFAAWRRRRP